MSSSSAAFKIFLEQKQQSGNDKFDWTKRKNQWISSIEDLYTLVTTWLEPFKRDKLLSMKITMIDLTEDYLGNYKVPRFDIYIGNNIVSLIPRGTLIVGAYGKIDMQGPKGDIILVQPEWNQWKFFQRKTKLVTWAVTSESFMKIIQDIV